MSTIATIAPSNRDMDKNEGKNIQNEGVNFLLVDRTDSNDHYQD